MYVSVCLTELRIDLYLYFFRIYPKIDDLMISSTNDITYQLTTESTMETITTQETKSGFVPDSAPTVECESGTKISDANITEQNSIISCLKRKLIVYAINIEVYSMFKAHLKNGHSELIRIDQSPNENRIYHLYSDGEITHQKGSYAYQCRSEFCLEPSVTSGNSPFTFPYQAGNPLYTYAILTEEECRAMRAKMVKYFENN